VLVSSVPRSPETVRGLQERAARALPAEHVEHVSGWWLRRSASSSWWMGTVLPHGDASRDELLRRISAAERFYAGFGLATRFQISPGACPAALDATLAGHGYRRDSPMSLQVASTVDVQAQARPDGPRIRLNDTPTTAWFEVWCAVHGHGGDPQIEWEMLSRVPQPNAYASALDGDEVIAVGRAVADAGWAGVFGMATLQEARGRGAARGILASLAGWATTQAADGMYLQVESDNDPALQLYDRTCFTEMCGYHYRTESPSLTSRLDAGWVVSGSGSVTGGGCEW
jgi:GNAT superfamily N-acetyltransferase